MSRLTCCIVALAIVFGLVEMTSTQSFNNPPTVSITRPASGSAFRAGSAVTVAVSAFDSDGQIARVEIFENTTKLGEATAPPYSFTAPNVSAG